MLEPFFLLALLFSICFVALIRIFLRPGRVYEYPYFMSVTFLVFICPQALAVTLSPFDPEVVSRMTLMAVLCLVSCWAGYQFRTRTDHFRFIAAPLDPDRLLAGGLAIVAIGWYFTARFNSIQADGPKLGGITTGVGTVYLFFAGLVYPGFAICLFHALLYRRLPGYLATFVASVVPIQIAVLHGRREATALFILTIGLALYFVRRISPPRVATVAGIVFVMLAIPAVTTYRTFSDEGVENALRKVDLRRSFESYFAEGAHLEVGNAALLIEGVTRTGRYQYGAGYWNQIVFRFVPAQLMGAEFKRSLMIGANEADAEELIREVNGIGIFTGTTLTGIGDAYLQLGYLGAGVFAIIGYLFRNLWDTARGRGGIAAQVAYVQLITTAMRAVTHQTVDFLPGTIYGVFFVWLIFLFAKNKTPGTCGRARWGAAVPVVAVRRFTL